jgi:hypothetical protein
MLCQSEHTAQLLVQKRECGRLKSPNRRSAQAQTVEESRVVGQYGRESIRRPVSSWENRRCSGVFAAALVRGTTAASGL